MLKLPGFASRADTMQARPPRPDVPIWSHMIRSMTAFASHNADSPVGPLGAEIRAVNHRYLELGLRLPDDLRSLEPAIRERLAKRLGRGKVDLMIRQTGGDNSALNLDPAMLAALGEAAYAVRAKLPNVAVELTQVLRWPGLLRAPDVDEARLGAAVDDLLDALLDAFVVAREREGARLRDALIERLDAISALTDEISALIPQIIAGIRTRLEARLADIADTDPARIETEVVLAMTKLDVAEEIDRLRSHVSEMRGALDDKAPVGRRLDFLLQEFNREANTLASKSVDARGTNIAVELKVLIEQLREQVQNIE